MSVTLTSTKAKVRDPERVREVVESYEWEGLEFHLQEEGPGWAPVMTYHDEELDSWRRPAAARGEELPSMEDHADEHDYTGRGEKWHE